MGDTPIIGVGTYANNNTCAISCTGHGEYFMKEVVAYDVSCLMEYKNCSLEEACEKVVQQKLKEIGGEGGLIAVDKNRELVSTFQLCRNVQRLRKRRRRANSSNLPINRLLPLFSLPFLKYGDLPYFKL